MSRKKKIDDFLKQTTRVKQKNTGKKTRCAHAGCTGEGLFPAPKSRESLREYVLFCQEHIIEYNKKWNFHEGMDEDEIEQSIRADITWNRPSWPFAKTGGTKNTKRHAHGMYDWSYLKDEFGILGDNEIASDQFDEKMRKFQPTQRAEITKAFRQLDMSPTDNFNHIKTRYRELAKKHHPDANHGDKKAEEKLKHINLAYQTLKNAFQTSKG